MASLSSLLPGGARLGDASIRREAFPAPLRQRRWQQQQWAAPPAPRLPAAPRASYGGGGGGGGPRRGGGNRQRQGPVNTTQLVQQYALPALGLLVVGSLVGPLVGGLVMGALGLGVAIAATAATLSISWVAIPFLAAFFGLPALMAGGMAAGVFATAAAGAFLLPSLIQLALVGAGLWVGASLAERIFYPASGSGSIDPDGTIDVEARTVDDDWREEMFQERRDREQELREFDDLLRRREDFKRRGPGGL